MGHIKIAGWPHSWRIRHTRRKPCPVDNSGLSCEMGAIYCAASRRRRNRRFKRFFFRQGFPFKLTRAAHKISGLQGALMHKIPGNVNARKARIKPVDNYRVIHKPGHLSGNRFPPVWPFDLNADKAYFSKSDHRQCIRESHHEHRTNGTAPPPLHTLHRWSCTA